MKVRNTGVIMWAKGMELAKDLPSGEVGAVLPDAVNSERLRSAIDSGSLVVIAEVKHVQTPGGIVQVVEGDSSFDVLTGKNEALGPHKGIIRRSTDQSSVETVDTEGLPLTEIEEFMHRKGGAKVKYIAEMKDLKALRQVLTTTKGKKALAAAQARIEELSSVVRSPEEMIGRAGQSADEQVEAAENRLSLDRKFTPNSPKTPEELALDQPRTPEDLLGQ